MFSRPYRRGFTLVELLVVIIVIAFLLFFCCRRFMVIVNLPAEQHVSTT